MNVRLWEFLNANCEQYIGSLSQCDRGSFLFRGNKKEVKNIRLFKNRLLDRIPLNTPKEIHDHINAINLHKFGWCVRNGAFCYGMNILKYETYDLGYGTNYLFFPIGAFSFVYDINIFDLYHKIEYENFNLEHLNYQSTDICRAIEPFVDGDGFGVEVCVRTESYLLVNQKYSDFLIDKIWGV